MEIQNQEHTQYEKNRNPLLKHSILNIENLQSFNEKAELKNDLAILNQDKSKSSKNTSMKNINESLIQKRGRKSLYEGAQYPHLIDKAKLILPQNDYDIEKILQIEEFKVLKNSSDLPRFLSKFILNQKSKRPSKSVKNACIYENFSQIDTQVKGSQNKIIKHQPPMRDTDEDILQDLVSQQVNIGAKIQSEITSNQIREFMTINQSKKYDFILKMFQRNSSSLLEFLLKLKTACPEQHYENMFRMIYDLNRQSPANIQIKARLFVSSLLYYNYEVIEIDQQLLQNALVLLASRPNTEQALGLANYIFLNEPEYLSQLQEELSTFDKGNIGIVQLMIGTFQLFKIDSQVVRLLPNTLLILNKPFIQLLKEDQGLRLIRDVPISLVGDFILICSLALPVSYTQLDNFISSMNNLFTNRWDFIDQDKFAQKSWQI